MNYSRPVISLKYAIFICCLSFSFSLQAKENFEGVWARSKAECLDKEGPNSRTYIDLDNKEKGKTVPVIDAYEFHCQIIKVNKSNKAISFSTQCDTPEGIQEGTEKITNQSKSSITMRGEKYIRCND